MSEKIRVIVTGEAGSGKSTAARTISMALRKAGFLVDLVDSDMVSEEQYNLRLKALRGTEVLIETKQANGR